MFAPRRTSVTRRGLPLLVGLAVGGLLIGATAVATPDAGRMPSVSAALGAPLVLPAPSGAPARAVPAPSTAAPRATVPAPAPVAAPPTALALAAPPPVPEEARPTTTEAPEPAAERTTTEEAASREPAPRRAAPAAGGTTGGVVSATNAERRAAGCDDLSVDLRLVAAAQGHADDMSANGYFSHTSRDGREFDDRIGDEGHPSPGGENIAAGQETAEAVVQAWMDSPGHRRNILDCSFSSIGVGHAASGDYWVQNFGR